MLIQNQFTNSKEIVKSFYMDDLILSDNNTDI